MFMKTENSGRLRGDKWSRYGGHMEQILNDPKRRQRALLPSCLPSPAGLIFVVLH